MCPGYEHEDKNNPLNRLVFLLRVKKKNPRFLVHWLLVHHFRKHVTYGILSEFSIHLVLASGTISTK